MPETLSDQQRRLARELILQAAADEIVEHGLGQLSLQAVADRAGVAERTPASNRSRRRSRHDDR